MSITVLSEKGQVVIPVEVRERLGLRRGDRFEVEARDDEIVFKLVPRNPLGRLRGAFRGPDSLTNELVREHQAEQGIEDAGHVRPRCSSHTGAGDR